MKIILFFSLFLLANCASQTDNQLSVNASSRSNSNEQAAGNSNLSVDLRKAGEEKSDELKLQSEQFKIVPEEFKKVGFGNFAFPVGARTIRLKNGEYDFSEKKVSSSESFSLKDVYFVNLTGDGKKEAILFLLAVSCGVSCDGGRIIVYFYTLQSDKPKLIGNIRTGAASDGCFLKSLTVKDKKIFIEQFGKCQKDSEVEDEPGPRSCKFCVEGLTSSVYSIDGFRIKKESGRVSETTQQDIKNYSTEVKISE